MLCSSVDDPPCYHTRSSIISQIESSTWDQNAFLWITKFEGGGKERISLLKPAQVSVLFGARLYSTAFVASLAYGVVRMAARVLCSLDCTCSNAVIWSLVYMISVAVFIVRFPARISSHPSSGQHITAINSPVFSTHRGYRDAPHVAFIVAVSYASTYPKDLIMRLTSIHNYTQIAPVCSKRLSCPRVVNFVVLRCGIVDSY